MTPTDGFSVLLKYFRRGILVYLVSCQRNAPRKLALREVTSLKLRNPPTFKTSLIGGVEAI